MQGREKPKVYPDFVFAVQHERVMVWETKGDQLTDNIYSAYTKALLERMSQAYAFEVQAASTQVTGDIEFILKKQLPRQHKRISA